MHFMSLSVSLWMEVGALYSLRGSRCSQVQHQCSCWRIKMTDSCHVLHITFPVFSWFSVCPCQVLRFADINLNALVLCINRSWKAKLYFKIGNSHTIISCPIAETYWLKVELLKQWLVCAGCCAIISFVGVSVRPLSANTITCILSC